MYVSHLKMMQSIWGGIVLTLTFLGCALQVQGFDTDAKTVLTPAVESSTHSWKPDVTPENKTSETFSVFATDGNHSITISQVSVEMSGTEINDSDMTATSNTMLDANSTENSLKDGTSLEEKRIASIASNMSDLESGMLDAQATKGWNRTYDKVEKYPFLSESAQNVTDTTFLNDLVGSELSNEINQDVVIENFGLSGTSDAEWTPGNQSHISFTKRNHPIPSDLQHGFSAPDFESQSVDLVNLNCSVLHRESRKPLGLNAPCEPNTTASESDVRAECCEINTAINNFLKTNTNSSNSTSNNDILEKIPIWNYGIVSAAMLNKILIYFRISIIFPVVISAMTVGLSVTVFRDKMFVYNGKPMIISFNIFEGLKCIAYLLYRMFKLHYGTSLLTWNSTYSRFFIYYVIWVPVSLGQIGILINGLITLDRFFTIVFPIKRFNKRFVTRPKLCVALIVVGVLLYQSAPLIMFYIFIEPYLDDETKFTQDEIISVIYQTDPSTYRRYTIVAAIGLIVFVYIPLVATLVLNTVLLISLWRHEKKRRGLTAESESARQPSRKSRGPVMKRQTNVVIVGSSMVFAILVLFRRVLPLFALLSDDFGEGRREMHLYIIINEIFHFVDCMSPFANIVSYTVLSTQFRKRLREILIPKCCLKSEAQGIYPENIYTVQSSG